jgi:hypothetical protein
MMAHIEASQRLATAKLPNNLGEEMRDLKQKGVRHPFNIEIELYFLVISVGKFHPRQNIQ